MNIVFDLDGTLIDSAPDIHATANVVLADEGLAGFDLPAGDSMMIMVEVPGPYTLHTAQPVTVDDIARAPGTVFELARGPHAVGPRSAPLRLLWGDRIKAPASPPPAPPYLLPY